MNVFIANNVDKNNLEMKNDAEKYKKTHPQIRVLKSTLLFNENKSLYTPTESTETISLLYFQNDPTLKQPNIVYTDLAKKASVIEKTVFEKVFQLKDSTRKINWKLTSETHEVAGYICRRANAVILDSVYVVALYADRIPVSGGPETFTGLPGMILELALPHDGIIWLAKSVTDKAISADIIKPSTKGQVITDKELQSNMQLTLKSWLGERERKSAYKALIL
jgi:GLPGLI family protein